jgi:hypothetical protein
MSTWCQGFKTFFFVIDAPTNKLVRLSLTSIFSLVLDL